MPFCIADLLYAILYKLYHYHLLFFTDFWSENSVEAGEMLHVAEAFIDKSYHPTVICRGKYVSVWNPLMFKQWGNILFLKTNKIYCAFAAYNKALEDALAVLDKIAMSIDVNDRKLHRCLILFW